MCFSVYYPKFRQKLHTVWVRSREQRIVFATLGSELMHASRACNTEQETAWVGVAMSVATITHGLCLILTYASGHTRERGVVSSNLDGDLSKEGAQELIQPPQVKRTTPPDGLLHLSFHFYLHRSLPSCLFFLRTNTHTHTHTHSWSGR